ncbi:MAG: hypothetical protein IJE10_11215 [Clostridia bacterium]|nr:hypothetical protein [Clostridia bacterium]
MKTAPTFNDTITLYHRISEQDANGRTVVQYVRAVVENAFFSALDGLKISGEQLVSDNQYIARLPLGTVVGELDLVVLGTVSDTVADSAGSRITDIATRYKPSCFFVKQIKINDKIPFAKHVKVTGV